MTVRPMAANVDTPPRDIQVLRLLVPYLWPADNRSLRLRLVLSMALLGLMAALNATVPVLFSRAIDHFSGPADIAVTLPLGLLVAYGAIHWLARAFSEMRWALYGPIEQRLRRRLGLDVFRHIHDLSLRFHLGRRTGQISRILENGMRAIAEILFNAVFLILPLFSEIVFICIVLLSSFSPSFAGIIVATLAIYLLILTRTSEWLRRHQRRAVVMGAEAHGKAIDSLLNYETVKYFGNEAHVAERYDGALHEVERLTVRALTWRSLTGLANVSVLGLGITALVVLAGRGVAAGTMTVGDMVLVNAYLLQLVRPLDRLGNLYRHIKQALTDLEQMMGLLRERAEVTDVPGAPALPRGPGAIRFEDVSFAYDPRRQILADVNFSVAPGRTTAIVGPSGGGKSTIGRLLFRFYDPTAGRVLIDGSDISRMTQDSVRATIAVVPQDTVLFNETIAYNIGFGRPDCTAKEIEVAAALAEIHEFVTTLPDGYDTVVGERGLKLSGGEKQRVAIARAVLKQPRIFLFDEATSALDSHTERSIQTNLRAVSRGVTTLVVAHRLSTIVDAGEILFVADGRIAERGTHGNLIAKDGLYAAMWRRQLEGRDEPDTDEYPDADVANL